MAKKSRQPLDEYEAKRDFAKTPEPRPSRSSSQTGAQEEKKKALEYVVQKHDATRMHYDVRLEIDGAMASWAVPKGPSFDPKVKRLAVETEDHPMEYNHFEGRIPDGAYGAGDVLVWDRGTYETIPPGAENAMRAKGHMHVRLFGEKLHGGWHLVRTRPTDGGKSQWLFFKAEDEDADPAFDVVAERPESVVTGRAATRGPARVGASPKGKSAGALLDAIGEVAKATQATRIEDPTKYTFEVKYDGYRILAGKAGREVKLRTRNANDYTERFAAITSAVRAIGAREAVLDGEVCAVDAEGRPSFAALQQLMAGEKNGASLAYAVFDLLWLDGRDLRELPIEQRRELLEALLKSAPTPISFSRAIEGDLVQILTLAKNAGLEGLVAKRKGSRYVAGHSPAWLKLKFERRQDCAVCGYTPLSGTKDFVGAIVLGVVSPDDPTKLVFAGKCGTGFDDRTRKDLARRLDAIASPKPTVEGAPRLPGVRWSRPELVADVGFAEWSRDHHLRQPRFLGFRDDKTASECVREADAQAPEHEAREVAPLKRMASTVKLSNATKVLFPRDGITKRDVFDYYVAIAPVMLPHIAGRPINMQRWPNGIDEESWFQHNLPPKVPDYVRVVSAEGKKRLVAENVETLQWLANLAALTLHQWASRAPYLDEPDYVVLDLDPGDKTKWSDVIEVAHAVRTLLDALRLPSAVKTSGKRGIHVFVSIHRGPSHDEATAFGEQIARAVAKVLPKIATIERMKEKRGGKLYVDYLQNGEGKTVVSPYTVRAVDGACVSTPIAWDEVTVDLDPRDFTIRSVPARVAQRGDLFAAALREGSAIPTLGR